MEVTFTQHELITDQTTFQILHLFTNPLIFVSQCYLLDLTPAFFGLEFKLFGITFKVNAAFFYLLYLVVYTFLLDTLSGFFHIIYVVFIFGFVPDFGKWVTRVVGVKMTNITAFFLYLFGQFSQILFGHWGREDFYDWNIYQVSHLIKCVFEYSTHSAHHFVIYSFLPFSSWSQFGT